MASASVYKVTVLYPRQPGSHFDFSYYKKHFEQTIRLLAGSCRKYEVDEGITGLSDGDEPAFTAIAHLYFDSIEDFRHHFAPHAKVILDDIPNYTNISPLIQISKIREEI